MHYRFATAPFVLLDLLIQIFSRPSAKKVVLSSEYVTGFSFKRRIQIVIAKHSHYEIEMQQLHVHSLIGSGGWSRTNSLVIQSHLRYQLRHSRMNWSRLIESNYRIRLHKPAFYH